MRRLPLVLVLVLAACSGGASSGTTVPASTAPATTAAATTTTSAIPAATPADAATEAAVQQAVDGAPIGCDPLDTRSCLLPYPSNAYTAGDSITPTGVRVAFPADGLPTSASGDRVDPTEWNRNDGFSPNTPLLTHIDQLDATASHLPGWNAIGTSLDPTSPVVLVDITSGDRLPLWAELDAHATADADRLLTMRPAVSLPEGHTFVVALRGLVTTSGASVIPSPAFRVFRDNLTTTVEAVEVRRPSMEAGFAALAKAGVARSDLQLAWTFTVASTQNISGRMLAIRDEALQQLGNVAPAYTIATVRNTGDKDIADGIARQVEGTFTVPNFLTGDGAPGNRFNYASNAADAQPSVNPDHPTLQAHFVCNISNATMTGTAPAHLVQYGHGLLGDDHEIDAGNVRDMSNEHNVVHCATKWSGMADEDIGNAAHTLAHMGDFATMADRLQQGVLNQIFLGRLMTRTGGLADDKTFHRADGSALVDPTHLDYDGNSQGGIMGLMLAAVSPDIERAVLGVPGMNYSLLLPRSVDFDTYEAIMKPAYPNDLDRTLIFGITQMLWDRGEGAGYVQHLTANPYEGTPAKTVLLDVAFGDHQVTPLSAFIEARTIGATIHTPITASGRGDLALAAWGLQPTAYPSKGSAVVVWDSGMAPMPVENLPPRVGDDSHEDPRADADVRAQKATFLFDDQLVDACAGAPCTADHRP